MRRREFITFLGSTALALPCTAHAQAPKLPTIGFLNSAAPDVGRQASRRFVKV